MVPEVRILLRPPNKVIMMKPLFCDTYYFKIEAYTPHALEVACSLIGGSTQRIKFWKSEGNKLYLSARWGDTPPAGYAHVPFPIELKGVAMFCNMWLATAEYPENPYEFGDGSSSKGWGLESIDESGSPEFVFYPVWMYHSK